jgi:flagellar motor protein MotB
MEPNLAARIAFKSHPSQASDSGIAVFAQNLAAPVSSLRKRFRRLRKLSGLSVTETARRSRVNVTRLSLFENGVAELKSEQILSLSKVLNRAIRIRAKQIQALLGGELRVRGSNS